MPGQLRTTWSTRSNGVVSGQPVSFRPVSGTLPVLVTVIVRVFRAASSLRS
ncbi:hypothetical protein ABZX92_00965 [Lentzea sp. NPDC006480]|uniref:hypothetical protein n=1 Tax=Lentzea sp. NPDC006480 TaxID=3157176 RepID=UPI0033B0996C